MGRRRKRRVAVVTGTRAEYGLLTSTMEAIRDSRRLELRLVATGMHLLRRFGATVRQIRADGWSVDAVVRMQRGDDTRLDQAQGLASGIRGIAGFLVETDADIVLVLGDRIEALAGALAGTTTGRLVAHVHGGDVAAGDFDDATRHAITKLSHVHLAATHDAARRIHRLGESRDRIHVVGAPGLDRLRAIAEGEHVTSDPSAALIVHHARGRKAVHEARVMRAILGAVTRRGLHATVVYPNTDRGHSGIVGAIQQARRDHRRSDLRVVRNLPRDAYLRQLIKSRVLIGNSSSGIIEAATAGTAVVNIGPRQKGRLRAGRCIVEADETAASINRALDRALRMRPRIGAKTAYGCGQAGSAIARVLETVDLSDAFRCKLICY